MTYAKPSVALAVWFYMNKNSTKVPNGVLLLWKKMPQEAASVDQHHIQFMIKDYPPLSAKWIETPADENCHNPQDCRCGAYENGKSEAECTHQLIATLPKL
jgi:hypothetical protein